MWHRAVAYPQFIYKWLIKGYRGSWAKSAVMVFSKDRVEGRWKWGEHEVSCYCYLGIDFASNRAYQKGH